MKPKLKVSINVNTFLKFLVHGLYCPMDRIPKHIYLDKWKKMSKKSEQKYVIGKLFTMKESSVIKRLQANNIMGCVFKTSIVDKTVSE